MMPEDRRDSAALCGMQFVAQPTSLSFAPQSCVAAPEPATTSLHMQTSSEVRSVLIISSGSYQIRPSAQDSPSSCSVRNCNKVLKYSLFVFIGVGKIAKSDY